MPSNNQVSWTAKLPTLLLGIVTAVIGLLLWAYSKSKSATIIATLVILLGGSFFTYSFTIKDWCIVKSDFGGDFSPDLHGCLKAKGWLEP